MLILYTLLNQMRVVKNIRRKDDKITSLEQLTAGILHNDFGFSLPSLHFSGKKGEK